RPRWSLFVRAGLVLALLATMLTASSTLVQAAPCDPPIPNPILCENSLSGTPRSTWDLSSPGQGDTSIQGFTTDISYRAPRSPSRSARPRPPTASISTDSGTTQVTARASSQALIPQPACRK